jgi:hypothetical protein
MSSNASSLRRILRSIGSHSTPTTISFRASGNPSSSLGTSNGSQLLGRVAQHHRGCKPQQHGGTSRAYSSATPLAASRDRLSETTDAPTGHDFDAPRQPDEGVHTSGAEAAMQKWKPAETFEPTTRKRGWSDKHHLLAERPSDERQRMKQQARRRLLSKERSEIPEEKAWQDTLRLLEEGSPTGPGNYLKRMETIRLPEGIFAKWNRDPGESILEVMQRTGSHVQVIPGREVGHFSSLTLLGTPAQNAAAKKLLHESDLLAALSQDDLNASKSLADYQLRSEISTRDGKTLQVPDGSEVSGVPASDEIDDNDLAALESAVFITTGNAPTRAVWSKPATPGPQQLPKLITPQEQTGSLAPSMASPASAVAFTARIERLTADQPRYVERTLVEPSRRQHDSIRDELVALMINPDNAGLITRVAAANALRYLAHHMYFPSVREILNALRDVKFKLDPDLFNVLLDAAAQNENVVAFHYIVNTMRSRSVSPNAGTWIAFHTLMYKRFPAEVEKVIAKMQAKAAQADHAARVDMLETFSAVLLAGFMESHPGASIKAFVKMMESDMPGIRWLTTFSGNKMCNFLTQRGNLQSAFEVVDEVVRHNGRPDAVTLNIFLTAAKKNGDMKMAVNILRKFHDLHSKSAALASTEDRPLTVLPRTHDLSIAPNRISFKLLCGLAWERKYFNCFRVFWRYACCAGHVDWNLVKSMRSSASSKGAREGLAAIEGLRQSFRSRIWSAWSAKFALGVKAGLDSSHAAEIMSVARGVEQSASRHLPGSDTAPDQTSSVPLSRTVATRKRLALLAADLAVVQSLKPVRGLADIAEEAWVKDRNWKHRNHGAAENTFDWMLKDGIEVPVEVGDGVGLKL